MFVNEFIATLKDGLAKGFLKVLDITSDAENHEYTIGVTPFSIVET